MRKVTGRNVKMPQQIKAASKFIVEYVIRDKDGNIKAQGVEGCECDVISTSAGNIKGKFKFNDEVKSAIENKDMIEVKMVKKTDP